MTTTSIPPDAPSTTAGHATAGRDVAIPVDLTWSERDRAQVALLDATWRTPLRGLRGWLSEVHHTNIGRRFIITAMIFFVLGGIEAAIMRWQLAVPDNDVVSADLYNQLFTVHGITMMFLYAVPVMEGMGLYLVPLMVGARQTAFPRL